MELFVVALGRKIKPSLIPFNIFKVSPIIPKVLDAITYRKVIILELET